LGDLGATYDGHLRLVGKRVVDFLSLGFTAEALRANTIVLVQIRRFRSKGRGAVDPKFQVEGITPTNHWYKNLD